MKKLFTALLFFLLSLIGCTKESSIEKATKVFERVKSETFFNLIKIEQKQIKGLNILDFGVEFTRKESGVDSLC